MPDTELLLVRHGRSAHVHTGWVDVEGVRRSAVADEQQLGVGHAGGATRRLAGNRAADRALEQRDLSGVVEIVLRQPDELFVRGIRRLGHERSGEPRT